MERRKESISFFFFFFNISKENFIKNQNKPKYIADLLPRRLTNDVEEGWNGGENTHMVEENCVLYIVFFFFISK